MNTTTIIFLSFILIILLIDNYNKQKELLDVVDTNLDFTLKTIKMANLYEIKLENIKDIIIKDEADKKIYAETIEKIKRELSKETTPVNSEDLG